MSTNEKQPPANPAAQQGQQPYFPPPPTEPSFPPPPPGPPPVQTSQAAQPPKHSNEVPLPDYDIPAYDPAHPHYAPPLNAAADDDIYNASPVDAHAPKWGHHHHESDGEGGKKKSHRLSGLGSAFTHKVAGPVNALANKLGSEGFLPESLDKECEKAARILRGFCKDGVYSDVNPSTAQAAGPSTSTTTTKPPPSPTGKTSKKPRVLLTIPPKVIARAQGLAIFTAVRLGFQATGSSGSGVLLARLPDGTWSPPSGIQITSIGAGFVAGVDIYDCVIVINTREALDLFTKTRLSLGSDLAVTAGPFGAGGALDWGVPAGRDEKPPPLPPRGRQNEATLSPPPLSADNTHFQTGYVPEDQQGMGEGEDAKEKDKDKKKKDRRPSPFREAITKPVYSYVKSRGLFAGVQIDGTVIAERENANARFYGHAVSVGKILKGEVPAQGPAGMWPAGAKGLFEVLKGAETTGPQHRPVSPGLTEPSPAFGTAPGTGGAPPSAWVPPPPQGAPPPAQGVPGVTAGLRNLGVGDSHGAAGAGPSSVPPPPTQTTATPGASAKAAEAASEAARAEHSPPPPPSYSEQHPGEDLPPAYVEDERSRLAGGDSKTGLH